MIRKTLTFILLISMALTGCNAQKERDSKQKTKAYIQLYSARDDIKKDFNATIAELGKFGYAGIEAANYDDGKFYNLTPAEFKKAINDAGMEVLSSHTGKALANDPSETDWNEIWAWWETAIAAHKEAGMKYIVTPSMPVPSTLADLKIYCDYYNQIGEKCNDAGLKFGYHNHAFEFQKIEDEIMYDYMIKNTDPEKVCFEMDVYWTVMGQKSPVEYFNTYPGRFEILHIKDHKELGQSGMVGFDAIFNNIDKAGTKYMVVEVEKYNYTPLESIKLSFDYLKNNKLFNEAILTFSETAN